MTPAGSTLASASSCPAGPHEPAAQASEAPVAATSENRASSWAPLGHAGHLSGAYGTMRQPGAATGTGLSGVRAGRAAETRCFPVASPAMAVPTPTAITVTATALTTV